MKNLFAQFVGLISMMFLGTAIAQGFRIPTPFGELRGTIDPVTIVTNPERYLNPTGLPTANDLVEYVIKHPDQIATLVQQPLDIQYVPVVNAMVSGRNAVLVNGGRRIPSNVKRALRAWYSDDLLDSVRWSTNWNVVQNSLQAAQMWFNKDTQAITLINAVVFRDSQSADDISLWAHELYHVQQYRDWGVLEFAKRWQNNSSDTGPVEGPAYDAQRQISSVLQSEAIPRIQPIRSGAECYEMNASTSYCDLWTANSESSSRFNVAGEAYATSDGTRSGRMQLVMISNRATCNSAASDSVMVDNATRLSGKGYSCIVAVPRGKTVRVMLVAPNSRADAKYTRAKASRL